jgi:hypothetical protein
MTLAYKCKDRIIADSGLYCKNLSQSWEPPTPRSGYESCKDGKELRNQLSRNADQWQRGYIDATFEIGEFLRNLFRSRFEDLRKVVGKPPGWESFVAEDRERFA